MRICEPRSAPHKILFFLRWQLFSVMLSLPGHAAFVLRGFSSESRCRAWDRLILAVKLIRIHLAITCAHRPLELLSIVEEIVELPETISGAVAECGSYLGGSSAKLSLAAAFSKRRLIVCDSFEGLPEVSSRDYAAAKEDFREGDFSARLEEVRSNVAFHGDIRCVEFVPGWYQESLTQLEGTSISCLFLDVDLQTSVKICLTALWKQVESGCKVFVHDVDRPPVVEPFQHWNSWAGRVGPPPARFVGAGSGLGRLKRSLGYAIKP